MARRLIRGGRNRTKAPVLIAWGLFRINNIRFQIKDDIKAARSEASKAYMLYVEMPKTS